MKTDTFGALGAFVLAAALAVGACSSDGSPSDGGVALEPPATTDRVDTTEPMPASPVAPSTAATGPTTDGTEQPIVPALDTVLAAIARDTGVPAIGAAVLDSDGVIDQAISGRRRRDDDTEVTEDDLFHLGSNTKAMTAVLLARLSEQGQGISFETTLGEAFPAMDDIDDDYAAVTLMQLLSHTAGVPGDEVDLDDSILSLPAADGRALGAELVLAEAPEIEPGTISAYSNPGYVIAAAAMEQAAGKPWEDLVTEHVFIPLDMTSCGFGVPGREGEGAQPSGHDASGDPVHWDNPALLAPAGGVHCSMSDWGRFLTELLRGLRGTSDFLDAQSFEALFRPESVPVAGVPEAHSAPGWLVFDQPDGPLYFHDGSNTVWYSQALISPATDRVFLAVTNEESTGEQAAAEAFAAMAEMEALR